MKKHGNVIAYLQWSVDKIKTISKNYKESQLWKVV